jgi:hypothetical protein
VQDVRLSITRVRTQAKTRRVRFRLIRCGYTVHFKMVVLRCTRQLLTRLKYSREDTSAQSTTRLGGWYGTLIRFGRRHVLLFISERSRLPVLLPVRDADRLALAFPIAVFGTLMRLGVPTPALEQERSSMSPIAIGPTRSRSLLASLNEFAFLARVDFITRRDRTLDAVARELAEVPLISPFKGECASVVTRRLFDLE